MQAAKRLLARRHKRDEKEGKNPEGNGSLYMSALPCSHFGSLQKEHTMLVAHLKGGTASCSVAVHDSTVEIRRFAHLTNQQEQAND